MKLIFLLFCCETTWAETVVVAADGSGQFTTIQAALDQASGEGRLTLQIRAGRYQESVLVKRPNVTFQGADAATTIITNNRSASTAGGTYNSATVHVEAAGFEASGISFENSFGTGSQAVAISIRSEGARFRNCRFSAWQDTLYAAQGRMTFEQCFIEGHVDFIFGDAQATFDHCEIHSRGAGYITAEGRTTPQGPGGYLFKDCHLTGENTGKGVFLGRPWRPYAKVRFENCVMEAHIRPEGWDNWRNAENETTADFEEQGSTGPGANNQARVPWAKTK